MDERIERVVDLEPAKGWLFLDPDLVPDRWRERARHVACVPLLPHEAAEVLNGYPATPANEFGDEDFLELVARGRSAQVIARRQGISTRSVHRRLARLRDAFQVETTAELAAELSRRGF